MRHDCCSCRAQVALCVCVVFVLNAGRVRDLGASAVADSLWCRAVVFCFQCAASDYVCMLLRFLFYLFACLVVGVGVYQLLRHSDPGGGLLRRDALQQHPSEQAATGLGARVRGVCADSRPFQGPGERLGGEACATLCVALDC
jgi:hypothetical protein